MYDCHKELRRLEKKGIFLSVESFVSVENAFWELTVLENGCLISRPTNFAARFTIKISVSKALTESDGQKIVPAIIEPGEGKKIRPLSGEEEEGLLVYRRKVVTKPLALDDKFTTKYVDNNVRIFVVKGNLFEMWEVAIVTRIDEMEEVSRYFLTIQLVYSSKMYMWANAQGKRMVAMPDFAGFESWDSLKEQIFGWIDMERLLSKQGKEKKMSTQKAEKKEVFKPNTGRVIFFNLANGKGFIESAEGPLPVHWSQIQTDNEFAHLEAGQLVEYKETGLEKSRFGTSNIQAVGVSLVS